MHSKIVEILHQTLNFVEILHQTLKIVEILHQTLNFVEILHQTLKVVEILHQTLNFLNFQVYTRKLLRYCTKLYFFWIFKYALENCWDIAPNFKFLWIRIQRLERSPLICSVAELEPEHHTFFCIIHILFFFIRLYTLKYTLKFPSVTCRGFGSRVFFSTCASSPIASAKKPSLPLREFAKTFASA